MDSFLSTYHQKSVFLNSLQNNPNGMVVILVCTIENSWLTTLCKANKKLEFCY